MHKLKMNVVTRSLTHRLTKDITQNTLHPSPIHPPRPAFRLSLSIPLLLPILISRARLGLFPSFLRHRPISTRCNPLLFPLLQHASEFDIAQIFALLRLRPGDLVP